MKDQSGHFAATLSLTEIIIGSILHAFHVPMSGHFLSINEGIILTFSVKKITSKTEAVKTASSVATVSALLKSLSPAGKKMLPMLAIAVQGILFSAGIAINGVNTLGIVMGMILLSTWAYLQPLLMAYLLFGQAFFNGVAKLWLELTQTLGIEDERANTLGIWLLCALVALKMITASALGAWAWNSQTLFEQKYFQWMEKYSQKTVMIFNQSKSQIPLAIQAKPKRSAILHSLKDLFNPVFIVSLVVSASFIFFATHKNLSDTGLYVLRSFALAWVVFFVIRVLPAEPLLKMLKKYPRLHQMLVDAQAEILKKSQRD